MRQRVALSKTLPRRVVSFSFAGVIKTASLDSPRTGTNPRSRFCFLEFVPYTLPSPLEMTVTAKRRSLVSRIGGFLNRSANAGDPTFNDAQRSFLVDCGMPHDANDDTVARYAASLDDINRAELEQLGDELPPEPTVERSEPTQTPSEPIQPTAAPPASSADIQRQIDEGVARALGEREKANNARLQFIRELDGDDIPRELVQRAQTEGWDEPRIARESETPHERSDPTRSAADREFTSAGPNSATLAKRCKPVCCFVKGSPWMIQSCAMIAPGRSFVAIKTTRDGCMI